MRHTLIPLPIRIAMHKEYHIRVISVALYALAVSILVGAVSLFPAFVRTGTIEKESESTVTAVKNGQDKGELAADQKQLAADGALVAALSAPIDEPDLSNPIQDIVSIKGPITISSLSVDSSPDGTVTATVNGVALTRDDLLAFQARLRNLAIGTQADLPISELAKDADIDFSMTVKGKLP
jgi:hypothetical protein